MNPSMIVGNGFQSGPYHSYGQLAELFGNPMISPVHFEQEWIIETNHQIASGFVIMRVNTVVALPLHRVFEDLTNEGLIDQLKTFDGSYVVRDVRGASVLSMHAFGLALDFNAETNQRGTHGDMPKEIVDCFIRHGWFWGGNFQHIPDPMHFEWTNGDI